MAAIPLVIDGIPSDIDMYCVPHPIEDARAAVLKARQEGVRSYCIAVDAPIDAAAVTTVTRPFRSACRPGGNELARGPNQVQRRICFASQFIMIRPCRRSPHRG